MLHLRKYALIVMRNHVESHVNRSLYSTTLRNSTLCRKGYVSQSKYRCNLQSRRPRTENIVNVRRPFATTVASSVDDINQKVISLCDDVNENRISAEKLKEVIQSCCESDYEMHPDTGMLLLKCCGNVLSNVAADERQELAEHVWHLMRKNGDALTLAHYNALLEIHAENSSSVDPVKFLVNMNVEPDSNTYRLLINAAAEADSIEYIQDIVSTMKEKNVSFEEDIFYTLFQTLIANDKQAEAERLIMCMKDLKLPTDKLSTKLACKYATQGNISNLVTLLNEEQMGSTDLLEVIKTLSVSGNSCYIPKILNFLKASIPTIESSEMLEIITQLINAKRATDAFTVLNYIILNGADDIQCFINKFLNELFMVNMPIKDVISFANEFVDSGYESSALHKIAETALKLGREASCLEIFATMKQKDIEIRPHYYWPLLAAAHRNEGETKVYSLVESMTSMGVDIDLDTLVNYVYPYVNTAQPIITVERLEQNNVSPCLLYTPMMYFLLLNGRLLDAIRLYQYCNIDLDFKILVRPLMRIYLTTKDVDNCVTMLMKSYYNQNFVSMFLIKLLRNVQFNIRDLQPLLERLVICNAKISQYDNVLIKQKIDNANILITTKKRLHHLLDRMVNPQLDRRDSTTAVISQSKYMNTKELACSLVELNNLGFGTRTVLRKLLNRYCNENNLKKAEEIKRELDDKRYQWTPGMKLNLFELYVRHNKLQEANQILSEIHNMFDSFVIDCDKILMFATALVKANKQRMALKITEKYLYYTHKNFVQSHCEQILDTLVQKKYYTCAENMLQIFLDKLYFKINTNILRPFVTIALQTNDIPTAVNMLEKYANKYKKLPAVVEVLMALLREDNISERNNIEKIYNIICSIKDSEVANTMLVIALAKLNKEEEMENILQKQDICVQSLVRYFKDIQSADEADSFFRILKAIPETNTSNQIVLYNLLLTTYSKTSDCKNALMLWDMMCEKNIKPDKSFQENFTQLLLANKVPLPSESELNKAKNTN